MAIQFVGRAGGSRAGATNTTTQSLTALTGGIGTQPAEGDLVLVAVCAGTAASRNPNQAISGWDTVGPQLFSDGTTYDTAFQVSYKFMGSTPDTSVTIPSSGNIEDGQARQVLVFRGVDPTTPLDVSPVSATGTATNRPDFPAITPITPGAFIVVTGGGSASTGNTGGSWGTPTNILGWGFTNGADVSDGSCGAGYYDGWTSGSYNPAAVVTGGSTSTANSWAAWTIALRPASAPTDAGYVKWWNGSAWVVKPLKVWDGSAWVIKPVKHWTGTQWKLSKGT